MLAEQKLAELGLELPPVPRPIGSYVTVRQEGKRLWLSGSGPIVEGKALWQGKVDAEVTPEEAYKAAEVSALNILAVLKDFLGDLDKVTSVVKLLGFVACADGFYGQPAVINGASDLLAKVFGDKGLHARSAVGVYSLPMNIPVEIELLVDIEEE